MEDVIFLKPETAAGRQQELSGLVKETRHTVAEIARVAVSRADSLPAVPDNPVYVPSSRRSGTLWFQKGWVWRAVYEGAGVFPARVGDHTDVSVTQISTEYMAARHFSSLAGRWLNAPRLRSAVRTLHVELAPPAGISNNGLEFGASINTNGLAAFNWQTHQTNPEHTGGPVSGPRGREDHIKPEALVHDYSTKFCNALAVTALVGDSLKAALDIDVEEELPPYTASPVVLFDAWQRVQLGAEPSGAERPLWAHSSITPLNRLIARGQDL